MAGKPILDLPEDIDDQIEAFVAKRGRLTDERVVRDIVRIHCLFHLVDEGVLGGKRSVLTGGMAMRCYDSPRFSVFDSDTSTDAVITDKQLLDALNYGDDDVSVSISEIDPKDRGLDLVSAHPITYDARFTGLTLSDTEFKLTVSQRGVERDAHWLPLRTGYPFPVLSRERDPHLPVMDPNELLAEKLAAWWIFAPAKHYADIAHLGLRLYKEGLVGDEETRADIRELVEKKLERNKKVSKTHRKRVEALTPVTKRERLENPQLYVDQRQSFDRLAFITARVPPLDRLRQAVRTWIVPVLFD